MLVDVGDTTKRAVGKVGMLAAAGVAMEEEALGIWSTEAEVRTGTSRPPEAGTGAEASRVEAGAEMISDALV